MILIIKIPRNMLDEILNNVSKNKPIEAVSFILGYEKNGIYVAREIINVKNSLNSASEFYVNPNDLLNIYKKAEENGMQIVAIVHSHQGLPVPSATDIKYMKLNPYVWIIVSMTDLKLQAYKLNEEKLETVNIIISL
ncbi:MAG: Mov34/MPN/PAD-1 family protein [Nitrososphaeria archaeon]